MKLLFSKAHARPNLRGLARALCLGALLICTGFLQTGCSASKGVSQSKSAGASPSSMDPGNNAAARSQRPARTGGPTLDYGQLKQDFEKRMEKVAKQKRKDARKMRKPQYSDPMYFGHKRKPKIRKPGKRKYCKECGMVH